MISLSAVFIVFVILGVVVGTMRGWAKELLVAMSALLGLFIILVFESFVPVYRDVIQTHPETHAVTAGQTCEDVARILGTSVEKLVAENPQVGPSCVVAEGMVVSYTNYTTEFWTKAVIMLLMAFIGYQTPVLKALQGAARREGLRDSLLGGVLGGVNAWMVIGSIWWYLHETGYEHFSRFVTAPVDGSEMAAAAMDLLKWMPPDLALSQQPWIYILIAIAFAIVLYVYV